MFLRKIASSRYYQKTRVWFVWLGFTLLIFSLTRIMLSLDLIRAWGISKLDLFLEVGFFYFLQLGEVLIVSLILGGLQLGIERLIRKSLDLVVQIVLVCILIIPFVNLLFAILKRPAL